MAKKVTPRPRVTVWDVAEAILGNRSQLGNLIRECGDPAIIRATFASLEHTAEDQRAYFVAVARGEEEPARESLAAQAKHIRRLAFACSNNDPLAGAQLMELAREHQVSTSGRGAYEVAEAIEAKLREAS